MSNYYIYVTITTFHVITFKNTQTQNKMNAFMTRLLILGRIQKRDLIA